MPKSTPPSWVRRVAITIGVPALVAVLGPRVPLPGVPSSLRELAPGTASSLFALGVLPIVYGHWIVELVAFFVPRWSKLRHDDPSGRGKLERAARSLTVLISAVMAYAYSITLTDVAGEDTVSKVSVIVSLIGGVCLQYVIARIVGRQGVLNGFLALLGAGLVGQTWREGARLTGLGPSTVDGDVTADPTALGIGILALASIGTATWIVLRGAGDRPWNRPSPTKRGTPYRDARALALHPDIPLPASSFHAYLFAFALFQLHETLATFNVPFPSRPAWLADERALVAALLLTTLICAWLFARILQRPAELGTLVERLGGKAGPKFVQETRQALSSAMLPTLLYFVVIVLAGRASPFGARAFALVVPIAIDLARGICLARRTDYVPIWDERRAGAIPILRAALASEGIASEVVGAATSSFWQIFIPIAPAVLFVPRADAGRASAHLLHLLTGAASPDRDSAAEPATLPAQPWSPKRRAGLLLLAIVGSIVAFAAYRVHAQPAARPQGAARAKLEIVLIDDAIDPFADVDETRIPEGEGIMLVDEQVPIGHGENASRRFARIAVDDGSKAAARARLAAWLKAFPLPNGARFGFEDQIDLDPVTGRPVIIGIRTFVLAGEPVVDERDVTEARATDPRDGTVPYVAITLSRDGAERFAATTGRWTGRRLAIVIDDEIAVAPVIRSAIPGGRVSITMGAGPRTEALARANELAQRLAP